MSQHPQHQTTGAGRKEGQPLPLASALNLCFCFLKSLPLSPSLFSLATDSGRPLGRVGRGREGWEPGLGSLPDSSAIYLFLLDYREDALESGGR